MKKRRTFTAEFKSKVVLDALRERESVHEIAKRYQVHPTQVSDWKKQALTNMGRAFEKTDERDEKLKEDRLFKQIGQLQVEVDFLKEACEGLGIGVPQDELDKLR